MFNVTYTLDLGPDFQSIENLDLDQILRLRRIMMRDYPNAYSKIRAYLVSTPNSKEPTL